MAEIRVPTLGESVTEATVATWFKKPGDSVAVDEMLCELETDKVTVEVPSSVAGTLEEIVAGEGETVGVDALLATVSEGASSGRDQQPKKAPKPAPKDQAKGEAVKVMVPALGESVTEATVSTWFKKVGDAVAADEMLCELETDKVSVEVPAPAAGTLSEILAAEGATVEAGGQLAVIAEGAGGAARPAAAAPEPAAGSGGKDVEDAPSAKKLMAEKGLSARSGSGYRQGRTYHEGRRGKSRQRTRRPAPGPRTGPGPARPGPGRGCGARGTGQDDPPAPDHRAPSQGQPEHRRDAHHLQRSGHGRGHGPAQRNTRTCFSRNTASSWASCPSSPRPAATR